MVSRLFEEDRPVRPVRIQQPLRAHTEYSAFSKHTPHSDFVAENNDTKLSFTPAKKKKKKKKALMPVPAHYKKQRAKPKAGRRKVTPKKKKKTGKDLSSNLKDFEKHSSRLQNQNQNQNQNHRHGRPKQQEESHRQTQLSRGRRHRIQN